MSVLEPIKQHMSSGQYEAAFEIARQVAMGRGQARIRVQACFLAAECMARVNKVHLAAQYLDEAKRLGKHDPEVAAKALIITGKTAVRAGDAVIAERCFLEYLSSPGTTGELAPFARFGLAQVYEMRRSWVTAAETYIGAAVGFQNQGKQTEAVAAFQNAAWCHLNAARHAEAGLILANTAPLIDGQPVFQHVHGALSAYRLYLTGRNDEATALVYRLLGQSDCPSKWAGCLVAVVAGNLAHDNGDSNWLAAATALAQQYATDAVKEAGMCRLLDLVADLHRKTAALRA